MPALLAPDKKVTLVSKDGDKFEVSVKAIQISRLCETMIPDDDEECDSSDDDEDVGELAMIEVESVQIRFKNFC